MSSIHDRLQQLLDGEIDAADIADDPTLVSLADRIYGIKIAAVQPTKPRDANAILTPAADVTEVAPPTDMLVEVIAPAVPATPAVPLPDPNMALNMPPVPSGKKSPLRFVFAGGLMFCVLNLFGLFSSALSSLCETGTCRGEEQTIEPHEPSQNR